jgi:hypothetical protein
LSHLRRVSIPGKGIIDWMCVGITTKDTRPRIINSRSQLAHTDSLRLSGSVISGRLGSGSVHRGRAVMVMSSESF